MPDEFVTKDSCNNNIGRIVDRFDALKESIDRVLAKSDEYEKRISATETDIAVLKNRKLIIAGTIGGTGVVVGILSNLGKIIELLK